MMMMCIVVCCVAQKAVLTLIKSMNIEQLKKDVEDLKRGQAEILAMLSRDTERRVPTIEDEISEFRAMVRQGDDPVRALREIQRRKKNMGRKKL